MADAIEPEVGTSSMNGMNIDRAITINNGNPFAVKNIRIRCVFTTVATGKVTELQQTLTGPVKAGTEQTFRKVSFGFVDTQKAEGGCRVESATQL